MRRQLQRDRLMNSKYERLTSHRIASTSMKLILFYRQFLVPETKEITCLLNISFRGFFSRKKILSWDFAEE